MCLVSREWISLFHVMRGVGGWEQMPDSLRLPRPGKVGDAAFLGTFQCHSVLQFDDTSWNPRLWQSEEVSWGGCAAVLRTFTGVGPSSGLLPSPPSAAWVRKGSETDQEWWARESLPFALPLSFSPREQAVEGVLPQLPPLASQVSWKLWSWAWFLVNFLFLMF